ncbi:hypothetical protein ACMT1E_04345 [Sphingomonas flavalba]|uniref:hypothetical protein n=1 Tax=Sphingomonas flavalba TaxID=2559804 RepID=UPI0039E0F80E
MAKGYSKETVGVLDGSVPEKIADGRVLGGRVRAFTATFDLSETTVKRANGDSNVCFRIPAGHKVLYGLLLASVTMGASATIAIGNATTPAKYRAAATHTATTPTLFMLSSALDDDPLAAAEDVIITIGAADLPSSGILQVVMLTSAR